MKKFTLVLILLLFPVSVFAGEYVLVKGKGVEVCEEYGKNLNSTKPALTYAELERKLNPEFKDFSKPQWEKMYPEDVESEKLFPKVDLFLWERDANPMYYFPVTEYKNWRGTPVQYAQALKSYKASRRSLLSLGFPISKVDIDNDGKMENIAHDSTNNSSLLILSDDKTDIDLKKTTLVMQHPSRKAKEKKEFTERGEIEADAMHTLSYDVFIYKQKTYFDLWKKIREVRNGVRVWGDLRVFVIENKQIEELCVYQFQ